MSKALTLRDRANSDEFKLQLARALPKHVAPERFQRIVLTALARNPKLVDCEQVSFFNAVLTASQFGLEPDGRHAHLIPYGKTCQLIIDYKGLVELAYRSGQISFLHADVVCENDVFTFDRGELKSHLVDYRRPRGVVFAVYAMARFKDGSEKVEVMSRDDVEAVRARSRSKDSGPWVTDWNEMAKKTSFRRLSKWLPLSPEFRDALDIDDDRPAPAPAPAPSSPPEFVEVQEAPMPEVVGDVLDTMTPEQTAVVAFLAEEKIEFGTFTRALSKSSWEGISDLAATWTGPQDIPQQACARILNARKGVKTIVEKHGGGL